MIIVLMIRYIRYTELRRLFIAYLKEELDLCENIITFHERKFRSIPYDKRTGFVFRYNIPN